MNKIGSHIFVFWGIIILFGATLYAKGFNNFITVENNKLRDGKEVYRFISYNIPNLNFVEDELAFTKKYAYGLPTEFEIRDALVSIKQMGGRVVRTYTIPVRKQNENEDIPKYVLAPGVFKEEAFQCLDTMLALANEVGIRLIIPLLNNWKWMGGRPQYAVFRGKDEDEFWTDSQLIDDFKKTIDFVLNRMNTITGIQYKDDKAILCWETGNELSSPQEWSHAIMKYIKSIDENHLVMDGRNWHPGLSDELINDSASDIITTHHYEINPVDLIHKVNKAIDKVKTTDKAYIIGEFGFLGTPALRQILDLFTDSEYISGALIWSLRYHREKGGFYWHSEPLGRGVFKAYHWPGFTSGEEYDEKELLRLMRIKAFEIQNKEIPEITKPESPLLLEINNIADISWKGSAGASGYHIERALSENGPWIRIGINISDARYQYYPLFHDKSAEIGKSYFYRVLAVNEAGTSDPSNIVGPVKVKRHIFIDNMDDLMEQYSIKGNVSLKMNDDRKYKEDMYRILGEANSKIVYYVPGTISKCKLYSFSNHKEDIFSFLISSDGEKYEPIKFKAADYSGGEGYYGYENPIRFEITAEGEKASYLMIEFLKTAQLSRIEIWYE